MLLLRRYLNKSQNMHWQEELQNFLKFLFLTALRRAFLWNISLYSGMLRHIAHVRSHDTPAYYATV